MTLFHLLFKALNEVIRTARRLNDHECLAQAQYWLHLLSRDNPQASLGAAHHGHPSAAEQEKRTLDSLLARTKDLQLLELNSLAQLSNSEYHLNQGSSPSDTLNALLAASAGPDQTPDSTFLGSNYLLRSSAWATYGNSALSSLYSNLQTEHHPHDVNPTDFHQGEVRKAQNLAALGDYGSVFAIFDNLRSTVPLSVRWRDWVGSFGELLLGLCLDKGEISNSEQLISNLRSASSLLARRQLDEKIRLALYSSKVGQHTQVRDSRPVLVYCLLPDSFLFLLLHFFPLF